MSDYQFHEIAAIFPLIGGDDFSALESDVKTHGVREPIWLYEGKILDGRNRYTAALKSGIPFETKEFTGTAMEAIEFVWSLNFTRRHLDKGQAAIADARRNKLTDAYAAVRVAAKERQGTRNDLKHDIVEKIPQSSEVVEQIPQAIEPQEPKKLEPKTRDIRAKVAGTNPKYINLADRLVNEHPDLAAQVETGEKTMSQVQRELKKQELSEKTPPPPTGKYRVVYADPPWSYNDKCDAGSVQSGGAEKHYPSMTIPELCAMQVIDIVEDNAVLFLWTTSPLLEETFPLIKAWGFKYKASFVWDKVKHNMGHYNSVRHEFLLVCTRGSCTPDVKKLFDSVQSIERTEHSRKPDEFRDIIDTLYTTGKKIELFRRGDAPDGWNVWGNQADENS